MTHVVSPLFSAKCLDYPVNLRLLLELSRETPDLLAIECRPNELLKTIVNGQDERLYSLKYRHKPSYVSTVLRLLNYLHARRRRDYGITHGSLSEA